MEEEFEPPPREFGLAVAVVARALHDLKAGYRGKRYYEAVSAHVMIGKSAEDAKDFLLRRLNEEDNHWGQILRHYGMRPLTTARLSSLMRKKVKIGRSV